MLDKRTEAIQTKPAPENAGTKQLGPSPRVKIYTSKKKYQGYIFMPWPVMMGANNGVVLNAVWSNGKVVGLDVLKNDALGNSAFFNVPVQDLGTGHALLGVLKGDDGRILAALQHGVTVTPAFVQSVYSPAMTLPPGTMADNSHLSVSGSNWSSGAPTQAAPVLTDPTGAVLYGIYQGGGGIPGGFAHDQQ
ncbi:hypothetical protein [Nitrobacter sp. TKz-YC02]|uniref:hypothetical protein n=1 Tax=Nitrobacter sp. TKz-YC02 TaxID=3398704 RepID=UPI003CE8ACFB